MSDEEEAAVGEEEEEEGEDEEEEEGEAEVEEEPVKEQEEPEEEEPPPKEPETPKKPDRDEGEGEAAAEEPKLRRPPKAQKSEEKEMTEAERAMQEAKMRHQEEVEAKMQEYEEKRKEEKEEIERELNELKEKREQRRREAEETEKQMAERARIADEHRRRDEEAMLARKEAQKRKEEEQKKKRSAKLAGWLAGAHVNKTAPPNYKIVKREKAAAGAVGPGGKLSQAQVGELQQKEQSRQAFLAALLRRKMDPEALLINDLKKQILIIHKQVSRIESEKYDLEKRRERQEYDLKELHQRELQAARNKALQKGLDPTEAVESNHPPKIYVKSKHDRETDRRSYGERRTIYEAPKPPKKPAIARGTPRPPTDWGRSANEELELIRKNLGPPKYIEEVPVEGAKPPVKFAPLKLPDADAEEENPVEQNGEAEPRRPAKPPKPAPEGETAENAGEDGEALPTEKDELVKEGQEEFGKYTFRPGH